MIRVDGNVRRINVLPMEHKAVHNMVYDIMNDKRRKAYAEFLNRLLVRAPGTRALSLQRLQSARQRQHGVACDQYRDA